MTAVKAINLVLPEIKAHSSLVDPVVKMELVGRGYLSWHQKGNPELDYEETIVCTNKAVYISKAKKFHGAGSCLESGIHTFDFHFSFPPEVPSTFTSKVGCISFFMQGICCSHSTVLAKEWRYLLLQGISGDENVYMCMEARIDVVYLCCFIQGSVILCIALKKKTYFPGETTVFKTDIANRTCNYIRKVVLLYAALYRGFSNSADQYSLENQNEVTRLECQPSTTPFETMRVTSALVLPKPLPVTNALRGNNIMAFKYELVGTSNLSCWRISCSKISFEISQMLGRAKEQADCLSQRHLWEIPSAASMAEWAAG
uniref:Arrestin domain containing 5 n=1 Tax=Phasianus colchicus TaxID=9054 RepID=A0A669P831_PHACC